MPIRWTSMRLSSDSLDSGFGGLVSGCFCSIFNLKTYRPRWQGMHDAFMGRGDHMLTPAVIMEAANPVLWCPWRIHEYSIGDSK